MGHPLSKLNHRSKTQPISEHDRTRDELSSPRARSTSSSTNGFFNVQAQTPNPLETLVPIPNRVITHQEYTLTAPANTPKTTARTTCPIEAARRESNSTFFTTDIQLTVHCDSPDGGKTWVNMIQRPILGSTAAEFFGDKINPGEPFSLDDIIPTSRLADHQQWVQSLLQTGFVTHDGCPHHLWSRLKLRKQDTDRYVYFRSLTTGEEIPVLILISPHQLLQSDHYEITIVMRDLRREKKWVDDLIRNIMLTLHNFKNGPVAAIDFMTHLKTLHEIHYRDRNHLLDQIVRSDELTERIRLRTELDTLETLHHRQIQEIIDESMETLRYSLSRIAPSIEKELRAIADGKNPYPGVSCQIKTVLLTAISKEAKSNRADCALLNDTTPPDELMSYLSQQHEKRTVYILCDHPLENADIANTLFSTILNTLHNLIKNPFEHGASCLLIRMRMINDTQAHLEVIDNGEGIPLSRYQALFQETPSTAMLEDASERNWHRGLSLCIATLRQLKETASLDITWAKHRASDSPHIQTSPFDLSLDQGTCFKLTFPITPKPQNQPTLHHDKDSRFVHTSDRANPSLLRILLVDDDISILGTLARKIAQIIPTSIAKTLDTIKQLCDSEHGLALSDNVQLFCASRIDTAFRLFESIHPRYVITDYNMREGNGDQLIESIRQYEATHSHHPTSIFLHTDRVQYDAIACQLSGLNVIHLDKSAALPPALIMQIQQKQSSEESPFATERISHLSH